MGLRVLVADDSALMRVLLSEAVRASRVPVASIGVVRDGAEALEALRAACVDVLLTDLQMPGVDGVELVARIARTPELDRVHVVTLSSDARARVPAAAASSRVRVHIEKPFAFEVIGTVLAEIWREIQAKTRPGAPPR